MARNYYETLGLPMTAEETEIAARLDREFGQVSSLQRIPARQAEAEARGQALHQIRQTLLNPTTRSKYDAYLSAVESENRPQIGFAAQERTAKPLPGRAASVFCSTCGRAARDSAKFCAGCGASIELAAGDLSRIVSSPVGSEIVANGSTMPGVPPRNLPPPPPMPSWSGGSMGSPQGLPDVAAIPVAPPTNPPPSQPYSRTTAPNWSDLSPYYQNEFRKIYESGECYKGKWNWSAFVFSGIWALTKGVWLSVLIAFAVSIVTGGIGGIVYWIIFAARGNYMYYCAKIKDKQIPI